VRLWIPYNQCCTCNKKQVGNSFHLFVNSTLFFYLHFIMSDIENGLLDKPTRIVSLITIWVPRISLAVGLAALSFQVFVLYPWHSELSEQFAQLQAVVLNATSQVPK